MSEPRVCCFLLPRLPLRALSTLSPSLFVGNSIYVFVLLYICFRAFQHPLLRGQSPGLTLKSEETSDRLYILWTSLCHRQREVLSAPHVTATNPDGSTRRSLTWNNHIGVSYFSCFIFVCPPVIVLKATYAENSYIVLSCTHYKKRSFLTACVFWVGLTDPFRLELTVP